MKRFLTASFIFTLCLFLGVNQAQAVSKKDVKDVLKITKKMSKLSDSNKIEELSNFYSDNYKSFDGYGKDQLIQIFLTSCELYPDTKTKETIKKVDVQDDLIKVYVESTAKTNLDVEGAYAQYAAKNKIAGKMETKADYSMTYKKENDVWKVITDEIFEEITQIRYGEAIGADFSIETPDKITKGEEFTVKINVQIPKDRYVVGSIGHDKITFPPEKYFDPFRSIGRTGVLERVMRANDEGLNEYANSTFAYITPYVTAPSRAVTEEELKRAAIAGMGICVKRMNTKNLENSAL